MKRKSHSIDFIFVILLFFIFVVMSVVLVVIGSNVYNTISDRQNANSVARAALSYVSNKIQTSNDIEDKVSVIENNGTQILVINYIDAGVEYSTLIFYKEGYIREANILKGSEFTLDFGTNLIKAEEFKFDMDNEKRCVIISVTDEAGKVSSITVNLDSIK